MAILYFLSQNQPCIPDCRTPCANRPPRSLLPYAIKKPSATRQRSTRARPIRQQRTPCALPRRCGDKPPSTFPPTRACARFIRCGQTACLAESRPQRPGHSGRSGARTPLALCPQTNRELRPCQRDDARSRIQKGPFHSTGRSNAGRPATRRPPRILYNNGAPVTHGRLCPCPLPHLRRFLKPSGLHASAGHLPLPYPLP